MVKKQRSDF